MAASKTHTHILTQCSPASVGLAPIISYHWFLPHAHAQLRAKVIGRVRLSSLPVCLLIQNMPVLQIQAVLNTFYAFVECIWQKEAQTRQFFTVGIKILYFELATWARQLTTPRYMYLATCTM